MCGLAGFWDFSKNIPIEDARNILHKMVKSLEYRGPDAQDVWLDNDSGVFLGHRRLSIYDLSDKGMQPMLSSSGKYCIAFNGSIYNYKEIKKEITDNYNVKWKSLTDTEVILAGFDCWGIDKTLQKMEGMFAIVLYDIHEKKILLIRDRLGEKPIYYGLQNNFLLFASELKSIKTFPYANLTVDIGSAALQLQYGYIQAPFSIYKDFFKVEPGSYVVISKDKQIQKHVFWDLKQVCCQKKQDMSMNAAKEKFTSVFKGIIADQMQADVPVGVFLSGGVDSSIVTMFASQLCDNVKTFSIGFEYSSYNEAVEAKKIAKHFGTEHTELYVTEKEALDILPSIPHIYDEPFSDSSQIPTILVSKMAKEHVTVALSGDGGDEVFAGYNRHIMLPRISRYCDIVPGLVRRFLSDIMLCVPTKIYKNIYNFLIFASAGRFSHQAICSKLQKVAILLKYNNFADIYESTISQWNPPPINDYVPKPVTQDLWNDKLDLMLFNDALRYLPNDILTKVDRASMSVALETRAPFLNHKLVEFAWTLPNTLKISNIKGKLIPRSILTDFLPENLLSCTKKGFAIPLEHWLRGPLKDWAEYLLSPAILKKYEFIDALPIQNAWKKHAEGSFECQHELWNILVLLSWLENESFY